MHLNVYLLPHLFDEQELAGTTAVVVDILRATTTMLYALRSGASAVIPCVEVEEARQIASRSRSNSILAGERKGMRIPGFDLGNSPAEFTPEAVAGKLVVMTTTNGTRALRACRKASRVLLGAFVNISTVADELANTERVALVCAGTDGHVTREDVLFTGALIGKLRETELAACELNDEAELACAAWQASVGSRARHKRLIEALRASRGGRNLIELGYDSDIQTAAEFDAVPLMGELKSLGRTGGCATCLGRLSRVEVTR